MFHRIGTESPHLSPNAPHDAVSEIDFRRIIQNIAMRGTPISLLELVDGIRKGALPERAVVVTFDDGFRDNLIVGLPILQEFGVPATLYTSTGLIERSTTPYQYVLADLVARSDELSFEWCCRPYRFLMRTTIEKMESYNAIYRMLRSLPFEKREKLLEAVVDSKADKSRWDEMYLTWNELARIIHHRGTKTASWKS